MLDMDDNTMKWRFASDEEGSLNEEGSDDHLRHILAPGAAGASCAATAVMTSHQGVICCDGVGTRLGITVLEAAIEQAFEICLRVPHLGHILQGKDTVNFEPIKVTMH